MGMRSLLIEKKDIRANAEVIRDRAGGALVYAVLSGDGLGAGLLGLADVLRSCGISHFAVGEVEEVRALRDNGYAQEEILMLRTVGDTKQLEELIHLNAVCTVSSYESAALVSSVASALGMIAEVQIKVDCGLGFGGFLLDDSKKILSVYETLTNLAVVGTYTELQSQGRAISIQLDQFNQLIRAIQDGGHSPGIVHAAGSSLLLEQGNLGLDAVRIGTAFLGRCRQNKKNLLTPVGRGCVPVADLRWLPKGRTVGTMAEILLDRPTRVAVLPVGWQNGLGVERGKPLEPRSVFGKLKGGKRSTMTLHRKKVNVLGAPGGMETILDVTDVNCNVGDLVTFEIDPLFAQGFERVYR